MKDNPKTANQINSQLTGEIEFNPHHESKILLRRTDNGELTEHTFMNAEHAKDWLKTDTKNNERFTVCFATRATIGPACLGGYFQKVIPTVEREITCDKFIDEVMNGEHDAP